MRPYFKYYKHASSCLGSDVVRRSGLYMRDARVRVGSSVVRESDRRTSGRGHVRVVGAHVVVSGIGEKRFRCIYAPGFLTPTLGGDRGVAICHETVPVTTVGI